MEIKKTVWVIMTKDRKYIARGTPRDRYLVPIKNDAKRLLTYNSKGKAESGFKVSGFYGQHELLKKFGLGNIQQLVEAVEVEMIIRLKNK